MSNILTNLPKPFFVLAPMDDVTDTVFRQVVADTAPPDLFFTEFVNVDGLQSPGRERVAKKLQFTDAEKPLVAQIWGLNPDNFYQTARELAAAGYTGIDINMGCPEKSVVKNGACSALILNRPLAGDIIKATRQGILDGAQTSGIDPLPLSVKTRLGFNDIDLTWHEYLLGQGLEMLTIHGRTRKEMSEVPAHWDAIGQVREVRDRVAPGTSIVGNGDVQTRTHGLQLAKQYGLDGIMIGRGIFHDPYAFAEPSPWPNMSPVEKLRLYQSHIKLFAKTWPNNERRVHTLNKFCKVYVNGFDGAKELREQLMAANTPDDLLRQVKLAIERYATARDPSA
jgi:tRNA-dihydrouridine synthase